MNRVRYIIAWFPKTTGRLTGIDGSKPAEEGWYVLTCDDEGRQAFLGDAHATPEAAGRAAFSTPVFDSVIVRAGDPEAGPNLDGLFPSASGDPMSYPKGCGKKLAPGQWWNLCGETDMGQTAPILCEECWKPEFKTVQAEPLKLDRTPVNG